MDYYKRRRRHDSDDSDDYDDYDRYSRRRPRERKSNDNNFVSELLTLTKESEKQRNEIERLNKMLDEQMKQNKDLSTIVEANNIKFNALDEHIHKLKNFIDQPKEDNKQFFFPGINEEFDHNPAIFMERFPNKSVRKSLFR